MNIISMGSDYQVYDNGIKTHSQLPLGCYSVEFAQMRGFYLTAKDEVLKVNEARIYGSHQKRVQKVLNTYSLMNRNLGVLLSGPKGIGKSLFVRILAEEGMKKGLPVIVVNRAIPGIADFIEKIGQDIIVVFDEFEKTFADQKDWKPQDDMLSLFDGLDGGHKLYVVTCNDLSKLSEYMLNRPGRFHYHFSLGAPTKAEAEEYLTDSLLPQYHNLIEDIAGLTGVIDLPYDYLRAIAFEINQGYTLKETMLDLNITKPDMIRYDATIYLSDGTVFYSYGIKIDFTNPRPQYCSAYNGSNRLDIAFTPSLAKLVGSEYIINEGIYRETDDYIDDDWPEEKKREVIRFNSLTVNRIILNKLQSYNNRFFAD